MPYNRAGSVFPTGIIERAFAPDVAALAGGGYVVTWFFRSVDGDTVDVLAQRYTDGGEKIGTEFVVNTTTAGEQDAPAISALTNGGFVIIWADGTPDTSVRAQFFDAQGARVGGQIPVGDVTGLAGASANPEIVQLSANRLVAVWNSSDGNGDGVTAQLLDGSGNKVGIAFPVNLITTNAQTFTDVVTLTNGNFVVTWTDASGQSSEPLSVRAQIFDADGARVGNEFLVNTFNGGTNNGGALVAFDSGNFIASWSNATGTFLQLFSPTGQRIGDPISAPRPDLEITELDAGGFVVVSNGGSTGIFVQVYDAAGVKVGEELKVNTGGSSTASPNVVELDSGDLLITWQQRAGNTSSSFTVQSQIYQLSPADIAATPDADILVGTLGSDIIDGLAGNDTLTGGQGHDVIAGGTGSNMLSGDEGNDTLSVSGSGVNNVQGGTGSDILLLLWSDTDLAINGTVSTDNQEAGAFRVNISASPPIFGEFVNPDRSVTGAGIEIIWLAAGSGSDSVTTGNGADVIYAGAGNDTLDTGGGNDFLDGGAGVDTLIGRAGDDIYIVDDPNDVVTEQQDSGIDEIRTTLATFDLTTRFNIENLLGLGNVDNIFTGNPFNNSINGGAGDDQLFGMDGDDMLNGGAGADVTDGGFGNDLHVVNSSLDYVAERVGEGYDTVFASVSFRLAMDSDVEALSAISQSGTAAINLTGNHLNNYLYGNEGKNTLNGLTGADVMIGYGDNDTFLIDNAGDLAFEMDGGGYDTAFTHVSFVLVPLVEVEALAAISQSATTAIDLTGNEYDNILFGNAGANRLNGGRGNDVLISYGGADTFAFTTALGADNVDTIQAFDTINDVFALDDAVFAGLALGALNPNAFVSGSAAADADDRIIHNGATGQLFFDADGNGAGAAILFAIVQPGPTVVQAGDFIVI